MCDEILEISERLQNLTLSDNSDSHVRSELERGVLKPTSGRSRGNPALEALDDPSDFNVLAGKAWRSDESGNKSEDLFDEEQLVPERYRTYSDEGQLVLNCDEEGSESMLLDISDSTTRPKGL